MASNYKFRAINWTPNERIGESKFDQMAENADWLYRRTPRAIYTLPGGLRRAEGVKICSGRAIIAKREKSDSAKATVRFGNFFSARCEPIVTTGVVSNKLSKIFCTVNGIGKLQPDTRGFDVEVKIAGTAKRKGKISHSFYVTWQAVGY